MHISKRGADFTLSNRKMERLKSPHGVRRVGGQRAALGFTVEGSASSLRVSCDVEKGGKLSLGKPGQGKVHRRAGESRPKALGRTHRGDSASVAPYGGLHETKNSDSRANLFDLSVHESS